MALEGVEEAAERLGVSARRVRQLIAAGALDAFRVGNAWAVDVASVEERRRGPIQGGAPAGA